MLSDYEYLDLMIVEHLSRISQLPSPYPRTIARWLWILFVRLLIHFEILQWDLESESASFVQLGIHFDCAAHQLNNDFAYPETKTCAAEGRVMVI